MASQWVQPRSLPRLQKIEPKTLREALPRHSTERVRGRSLAVRHQAALHEHKIDKGYRTKDELAYQMHTIKDEYSRMRIAAEAQEREIARVKQESKRFEQQWEQEQAKLRSLRQRVKEVHLSQQRVDERVEMVRLQQSRLQQMRASRGRDIQILVRRINRIKLEIDKQRLQLKSTDLEVQAKVNFKLDLVRRIKEIGTVQKADYSQQKYQIKVREEQMARKDDFQQSKLKRVERRHCISLREHYRLQNQANHKFRTHILVQRLAGLILQHKLVTLDQQANLLGGTFSRMKLQGSRILQPNSQPISQDFFRATQGFDAFRVNSHALDQGLAFQERRRAVNKSKLQDLQKQAFLIQQRLKQRELVSYVSQPEPRGRQISPSKGQQTLVRIRLWAQKWLGQLGMKTDQSRLESSIRVLCSQTRAELLGTRK